MDFIVHSPEAVQAEHVARTERIRGLWGSKRRRKVADGSPQPPRPMPEPATHTTPEPAPQPAPAIHETRAEERITSESAQDREDELVASAR